MFNPNSSVDITNLYVSKSIHLLRNAERVFHENARQFFVAFGVQRTVV